MLLPSIKPTKKNAEIYPSFDYILRFDGGSRGNPGPSGCGAVIYYNNDEIWADHLFISEKQTNNYAEYMGLIIGLEQAFKMNIKELSIEGDSLLVINQLTNKYKCKSENLIDLNVKACKLSKLFKNITFNHILRHNNKRADELSNIAMDKGTI
jgi:ribonuclease HI